VTYATFIYESVSNEIIELFNYSAFSEFRGSFEIAKTDCLAKSCILFINARVRKRQSTQMRKQFTTWY